MNSRKNERKKEQQVYNPVYGKVPPQAKDLEGAILGAIMLEKTAIDRVAEYLRPEHFYVDTHQKIFTAMLSIHSRHLPIDLLVTTEELRKMGEIENVGGDYYVSKLTNDVVSSANIEYHARIILEKWRKREMIKIAGQLLTDAYEDQIDSQDILSQHDKNITGLISNAQEKGVVGIDSAIMGAFQQIEKLRLNPNVIKGVPTGYKTIDRITNGWQNTDLIILAARPSVGKTAFALNLARNAILSNSKPTAVVFFSLEMSTIQLTNRLLSAESEIWLEKINSGRLSDQEHRQLFEKGLQRLVSTSLHIDDTSGINLFELRAKCRRLKNKKNIGMIIIDYLQLMSGTGGEMKVTNREQEISTISRGLKGLAKELQVPIIALSQLTRDPDKRKGDDKQPKLSDLRESGAIEQDADMVMFLYRPEYYEETQTAEGESTKGLTILSIPKNRNGRLAIGDDKIQLHANLAIQKFTEWEGGFDSGSNRLPILPNGGGRWTPYKDDSNDNSKEDIEF